MPSAAKTLEIEQKAARTAIREKPFQTVKHLRREGMPILAIVRRLKMNRNPVKRFLSIKSAPQRQPNCPRFSPLQQFPPYLQKRWTEAGEGGSRRLGQEIKAQGYPGAEVTLRDFRQKWRETQAAEIRAQIIIKANAPGRAPSVRQSKRLLFGNQVKPKEQWEEMFLQQLCQTVPAIESGQKLVKEFHR